MIGKRTDTDEIVAIEASATARELRVDKTPPTQITTRGRGRVVTHRRGLPPSGAKPGVTYENVEVSLEISSGAPEQHDNRSSR